MVADRSHIHHKLIDMGLNQKQAVATLYIISGVLGLSAVLLATSGGAKTALFILALVICAVVAVRAIWLHHPDHHPGAEEGAAPPAEPEKTGEAPCEKPEAAIKGEERAHE